MSLSVGNVSNNQYKKNVTFGFNPLKSIERVTFRDAAEVCIDVMKKTDKKGAQEFDKSLNQPMTKFFSMFFNSGMRESAVPRLRKTCPDVKTLGDLQQAITTGKASDFAGDILYILACINPKHFSK